MKYKIYDKSVQSYTDNCTLHNQKHGMFCENLQP